MIRKQTIRRWWAPVVLPATVPLALAMSVTSIKVTPNDIAHGGGAIGSATITASTLISSNVNLSSSNPGVATVPSFVAVKR